MTQSIAIMIRCPALSSTSETALKFAHTVIMQNKQISLLFFYGEAVQTAASLAVSIQGDTPVISNWQAFIQTHKLPAIACITSALKRGVIDKQEADRHQKSGENIAQGIKLGGLGQWADAVKQSDQHIIFG